MTDSNSQVKLLHVANKILIPGMWKGGPFYVQVGVDDHWNSDGADDLFHRFEQFMNECISLKALFKQCTPVSASHFLHSFLWTKKCEQNLPPLAQQSVFSSGSAQRTKRDVSCAAVLFGGIETRIFCRLRERNTCGCLLWTLLTTSVCWHTALFFGKLASEPSSVSSRRRHSHLATCSTHCVGGLRCQWIGTGRFCMPGHSLGRLLHRCVHLHQHSPAIRETHQVTSIGKGGSVSWFDTKWFCSWKQVEKAYIHWLIRIRWLVVCQVCCVKFSLLVRMTFRQNCVVAGSAKRQLLLTETDSGYFWHPTPGNIENGKTFDLKWNDGWFDVFTLLICVLTNPVSSVEMRMRGFDCHKSTCAGVSWSLCPWRSLDTVGLALRTLSFVSVARLCLDRCSAEWSTCGKKSSWGSGTFHTRTLAKQNPGRSPGFPSNVDTLSTRQVWHSRLATACHKCLCTGGVERGGGRSGVLHASGPHPNPRNRNQTNVDTKRVLVRTYAIGGIAYPVVGGFAQVPDIAFVEIVVFWLRFSCLVPSKTSRRVQSLDWKLSIKANTRRDGNSLHLKGGFLPVRDLDCSAVIHMIRPQG